MSLVVQIWYCMHMVAEVCNVDARLEHPSLHNPAFQEHHVMLLKMNVLERQLEHSSLVCKLVAAIWKGTKVLLSDI